MILTKEAVMLLELRMEMLKRGIRQSRMAFDLGWDPAKLSRIVNGLKPPTADEREAIAAYVGLAEAELFVGSGNRAD
jgi:transcriptional regulator with XRE-family HTH domain